MDLGIASTFFDNDPLYDAYTGQYLYDAQFASYDGSQLDGSFIRRRTVSMAPEYQLPPRRAVMLYGEPWVISDPIRDGFLGGLVRQTMSARKAHGLYQLLTAGELLLGTATPRTAYAFCNLTKGTADASTSDLEPYFEFSFSVTEEEIAKRFIVLGDRVWHARMEADVSEGFKFVEADEIVEDGALSYARVTVSKSEGVDPVTLQPGPTVEFPALMVERYVFFRRKDQAQPLNHAGDKTLVVAKASDPDPTGNYTIEGKLWSILGKQDLGDGFGLHLRRVS